nr:thiamine transporter membrane protein [Candidatus Pantoea persica]
MLCFASFATVLSLGGGPQATTIELAIFQALSYGYDPGRAALLALIQLAFCLTLVLPPLLAVIADGLRGGLLCMVLTMMLLWSSRELRLRQRVWPA